MNKETIQSVINGLNETGIHQEYALFFVSPGTGALFSFLLAATLLTLQLMPLGAHRKRK
ncbi:hypothetical protein [Serratia marcescens]|uniref:hypothetical protein n=1 Tax=Serratia marcescens TaxID=615 RepID=UPI003D6FCE73